MSRLFFHEHLSLYSRIDLSRNQLSSLGPDTHCLVSVFELILDGNQLEQLPPELAALRLLCSLSMKDNSIQRVGLDREQHTSYWYLFKEFCILG